MKFLSKYLCILFLLISFSSKAEEVNLDSLWGVWNDKNQPDTSRIEAMHKIAYVCVMGVKVT